MLTNIMCENVHRCTFSRQLDVSNGHLCPKWNIEAFLMLQEGAQLWSDIIQGSDQAIAYHKSVWQMQAFDDSTFPPTVNKCSPARFSSATQRAAQLRSRN